MEYLCRGIWTLSELMAGRETPALPAWHNRYLNDFHALVAAREAVALESLDMEDDA